MNKLRVVETYVSYQGEGPNTSRPTVFVRFAGCNFKCPGWPCDTQHAIDPKQFSKLQKFWEPEVLVEHVASFGVANVCLTGGEVFLQESEALLTFVQLLQGKRMAIECFTNGGLRWSVDVAHFIDTFVLDWKLPGSGEEYAPTDVLAHNISQMGATDAIKFTIKTRDDYLEAKRRYFEYAQPGKFFSGKNSPVVYAGVVWGKLEAETLCGWMIEDKLPWRLNVQVHKFVWHPDKIGV